MSETQRPLASPVSAVQGPHRLAVHLSSEAHEKAKHDHSTLPALLEKAIPGAGYNSRAEPLITSMSPEEVDQLVARAASLDPTYQPVNFGEWYLIHLDHSESTPSQSIAGEQRFRAKTPGDVPKLVQQLHSLNEVQSAHQLSIAPPPTVIQHGVNNPLSFQQGYLNPAPQGIDAHYGWNFPGGDGVGIGFVDMEEGWNLSHEDLMAAKIVLISGSNQAFCDHGTAALGEVLMSDNTIGGIGVAPHATGRVISQWQNGAYNIPAAIMGAVAVMKYGDVLLLEAQVYDPVHRTNPDGSFFLMPVEAEDAIFDAIRTATAFGIVVIEAGANGGVNLDTYTNLTGLHILNRSSNDFRDSGAIMVGASSSSLPHSRIQTTDFGSRIDVYAWGENVETCISNVDGTGNNLYAFGFDGTSSASPIIAGAALAIQGIAQARSGSTDPHKRFAPLDLRRILKIGGTASANPASDLIGVMPNLHAIIDAQFTKPTPPVGTYSPDIWIRDAVGDFGDRSLTGILATSPDIIIRQNPVANPQAFASASLAISNTLSEDVLVGHPQFIYVRLLNRGSSNASAVSVSVFFAPPSTLVTPDLWRNIGTTTIPNLPKGNILTVTSDPIIWQPAAIPGPGHYCFVAVAGNSADPGPLSPSLATFDNFIAFMESNNNTAFCNFNLISAPPNGDASAFHHLPLLIPGAFDSPRTFTIESFGSLPLGSEVEMRMPPSLSQQLNVQLQEGNLEANTIGIPLPGNQRVTIGTGTIYQGSKAQCEIRIRVSGGTYWNPGMFEFAVRQIYQGKEVGRVGWRFGQGTKI